MTQVASNTRTALRRAATPSAVLALVLLLSFALRIAAITTNPPELFEDELAPAASAWSIVTTGYDVAATHLPFFVTRLDLRAPAYGYSTVPFQALLGHTILAVRLPAVLFGVAATFLVAWLVRVLGRRPWEGVVAAFVFAVTPWAVHYGRIGWEPASTLPFTIGGVGLLWDGLARRRPRRVAAAAVILALGAYTYTPALLANVLLAGVTVLIMAARLRRRDLAGLAAGAVGALVVLAPYLLAFSDPLFTKRTAGVSVFRNGVTLDAVSTAWNHYWAQWDPTFLFLRGTANLRNEPGMGVLLLVLLPPLIVGVAALLARRRAADLLLLGWLAVGPVAAALTDDGVPHFARGIFALPAVVLVVARGAMAAWDWLRIHRDPVVRPIAAGLAALLVVIQLGGTYDAYFGRYPAASASAWRVGTAAAMTMVRDGVPAGGTACLDTAALSYWTFPQFVAWFLPQPAFTVVEGVSDARCSVAGAYLFGHQSAKVPATALLVASSPGADAGSVFLLWTIPG